MRTKTKVTMTIDTVLLQSTRTILKEQGLKMSTYVQMVMRALVESEKLPMKDVYQNIAGELFGSMKKGKKKGK